MAADWNRRRDRDDEPARARQEPMRAASPEEESYGGRGYEHVGQEQQGGWRGPGEMPGYQEAARRRPRPFLQQTSGGQIPGELREWDRPDPRLGPRPEPRDHDPRDRDRDRDPRSGSLAGLEGRPMPRTGPHAGRGPRNYRRPDHRIHEELCERLTDDPWVDARDIEVEVAEARVVLRGAVPDRSMKHRAEDLADSVFGVADVENQIRVQRPGGSRAPRGDATRGSAEDAGGEGGDRGEDRH